MKTKIMVLQIVPILLLMYLHTVAIEELIGLFSLILGTSYSAFVLAFILTVVGIGLGIVFSFVTNLKGDYRRPIMYGVPGFIIILMMVTYFAGGVLLLFELVIILTEIAIGFSLCVTALIGTYGIIKHQKNLVIASASGILFHFIFIKILMGEFASTIVDVDHFLVFVILLFGYLEFGILSNFFNYSLETITPKDTEEKVLLRVNRVFNRQLGMVILVLLVSYAGSVVILRYRNLFYSMTSGELMDVAFDSIYGMWLLLAFITVGMVALWLLIPREKTPLKGDE